MRAQDQFHAGIVVDDFEGTLQALSELFGYVWCDEMAYSVDVELPDRTDVVNIRMRYSRTAPHVEIVQSVPGTLWQPAAGSGVHHLGYWSDDLAGDSALLERRGYAREAAGMGPDGGPMWAYHRNPAGPRIELVSRALQPVMEQYFAGGGG